MKKQLLFAMLTIAITGTTISCSSDRDDETEASVQDFTNAEFIKTTMAGTWNLTHVNYSGTWDSVEATAYPGQIQLKSYYTFNADNTYLYKPFTDPSNNSMNVSGTYTIIPAVKDVAPAKLKLTSANNSKSINLNSYANGIVEISQYTTACPSGECKERFQKQ